MPPQDANPTPSFGGFGLKRRLMVTFASDPPAYNAAKAAFIESVVEEARLEKTSPDRS